MKLEQISHLVFQAAIELDEKLKKLDMKEIKKIVEEGFEVNSSDFDKNFSNVKGEVSYSDDEGTKHLDITGTVNKDWFDKMWEGEDLKKVEKALSRSYSGGPGFAFSRSVFTLKSKGDKIEFSIHVHSGLDI
jgi:uncharacterized protein YfbU (UPF0304 family)